MASNDIIQCTSSSSHPKMTYDVFVSFHDDTRNNFTAFLFSALREKGIDAFRYNGKKGESIAHEVLQAIQGSRIFIVVCTTNYASSTCCLRELTEICNCVKTLKRRLLPIIYEFGQKESYMEAFSKHVEKFKKDKEKMRELEEWNIALTLFGNVRRWGSKDGEWNILHNFRLHSFKDGWGFEDEIERAQRVYMQIEEVFAKYVQEFREYKELMKLLQRCRESLTQMANLSSSDMRNKVEIAHGDYMQNEEAFHKYIQKFSENKELMEELQRCREPPIQMVNLSGLDLRNEIERAQRIYMQIEEVFAKYIQNFGECNELRKLLQRFRECLTQMVNFCKVESAQLDYMRIEKAFHKYIQKFSENKELMEELQRPIEHPIDMANLSGGDLRRNEIERAQRFYMQIEEAFAEYIENFRENKELMKLLQRCRESLTQMVNFCSSDMRNEVEIAQWNYMQIEEAFHKYIQKFSENKELMEELQRCREPLTQMVNLSGWDLRNEIERAQRDYMQIEEAFPKYVEKFKESKELTEELQRYRESLTQLDILRGRDITDIIKRAQRDYMQIEEAFHKYVEKFSEKKKLMDEVQRWRESLIQSVNLPGGDFKNEIERAESAYMQENKELMEELQRYRDSLTQMENLFRWDVSNKIERGQRVYMQIEETFDKYIERFSENKGLMEELHRCRESLKEDFDIWNWQDLRNEIERAQWVYMQIEEEFTKYVEKFRENKELMEELQRCRESLTQMVILCGGDIKNKIEAVLCEKVVEAVLQKLSPSQKLASSYPKKHDVFLSFRGEDTRRSFVSHLYKALNDKNVKAYIDNQLEKGDEISPALAKAIEDSYVSVVIFSENYASSKWCLCELSKILECKKVQEQIVIPVFYNTDPSHVRNQTESYKQAFAKHEGDPRCNKWRSDLTEAANLVGFDSQNRIEAEFIKDIVEDVLQKLAPMYPNQRKQPIGIEQNYEQIESLLKIGSSEVKITIGIWGMGGIGKTTLARTLYDNLSCKFEDCCFLENVRERSNKLEDLCDKLFSKLLKNENHGFGNFETYRLKRKKVFVVLDDVASSEQLHRLINEYDFLGPGSRVIVTARDKQILAPLDGIYPVKELSSHHSLQLFCLTAFGQKQPKDGYEDLSRSVVSYCKGVPLALKVLGASLYKKDEPKWKSKLSTLGKIQNLEIHKVLRLSYDGLDPYEQDIFLDIACFFKRCHRDRLTSLLEACGFHPESGIDTLLDKCLITISDDNGIEMHDLIQEMGWKIVDEEDIKDPGKRSRLWRHDEVLELLEDNTVTRAVKGIIFDLCKLTKDLDLSSISLANMSNVRYLMIHDSSGRSNGFKVCLPDGESLLSNKLRCLHWDRFCLDSLPSTFHGKHLVELRMRDSKLKKLGNRVRDLVNLKTIDFSYSRNLIEIPDLSKADKLESVVLIDCERLCQLHVQSKSLCVVRLDGCSSLEKFSMTSAKITELNLDNTAICALPSSIWCSTKLACLSLKGWRDLTFVENIGHLSSLEELDLSGTNIVEINPEIFEKLSMLKRLRLDGCDKLKSLPELPISLQEVSAVNCISLDTEITQQLVLLHMLHNKCPCHFIFPGNHFIETCFLRTAASSITIDCLPKSNFCGLIYCFIISKHGKGFHTIPVSCCICQQDDIQIVRDDKAIACGSNLISDHVLFSYVDTSRFDGISELRDNFDILFEFDHYDETINFRHDQERIKGCGLFPVYATERSSNKLLSAVEYYEPRLEALRREMKRARTSE